MDNMSQSENTTSGKPRQLEILDIMQNFNFHKKVSPRVLKSYCDRKGYEFLASGEYEDHVYNYEHDQRAKVVVPLIIAELQKFQTIEDYIGDAKRAALKKENEQLEFNICRICEEQGVHYREINPLIKNLAAELSTLIENTATRMNNMGTAVLDHMSAHHFGRDYPLVADMGAYHRKASGQKEEEEAVE